MNPSREQAIANLQRMYREEGMAAPKWLKHFHAKAKKAYHGLFADSRNQKGNLANDTHKTLKDHGFEEHRHHEDIERDPVGNLHSVGGTTYGGYGEMHDLSWREKNQKPGEEGEDEGEDEKPKAGKPDKPKLPPKFKKEKEEAPAEKKDDTLEKGDWKGASKKLQKLGYKPHYEGHNIHRLKHPETGSEVTVVNHGSGRYKVHVVHPIDGKPRHVVPEGKQPGDDKYKAGNEEDRKTEEDLKKEAEKKAKLDPKNRGKLASKHKAWMDKEKNRPKPAPEPVSPPKPVKMKTSQRAVGKKLLTHGLEHFKHNRNRSKLHQNTDGSKWGIHNFKAKTPQDHAKAANALHKSIVGEGYTPGKKSSRKVENGTIHSTVYASGTGRKRHLVKVRHFHPHKAAQAKGFKHRTLVMHPE